MGSNINSAVQQVYVINAAQVGSGGGGGGGNVNIVSSVPLDVNILNPCISICDIGISISAISVSPQVSIIQSIPLDVNFTGVPGATPVPTYDEVLAVPANSLTTVTFYTVPAGKTYYAQGFVAGGTANAWFKLDINGNVVLSARSTTAQQTVTPSFLGATPLALAGETVTLKVIHSAIGVTPDFEGSILGVII